MPPEILYLPTKLHDVIKQKTTSGMICYSTIQYFRVQLKCDGTLWRREEKWRGITSFHVYVLLWLLRVAMLRVAHARVWWEGFSRSGFGCDGLSLDRLPLTCGIMRVTCDIKFIERPNKMQPCSIIYYSNVS